MMASKGQEAFAKHFEAAHTAAAEKEGRVAKAIDPATITLIFGFIIEGLKICFNRNGEQATMARIKEGGGLSQREVFRALIKGGYGDDGTNRDQRKKCKQTAYELAGQGQKVSAEDLEEFMNDAKQSNVPADTGDAGFWNFGAALLLGIFLFGGTASASDGFWNFEQDVKEIKSKVEGLGSSVATLTYRVDVIDTKLDKLIRTIEQKGTPEPPEEPAPTLAPVAKPSKVSSGAVSGGILLNGRSIGDVNAYIRSNPAGHVGVNGSLVLHLRQHGFTGSLESLTRNQQQKLHDIAHAKGYPARTIYHTSLGATTAPASSGCANGQCARQSMTSGGHYKTGLFGRTRWVSN